MMSEISNLEIAKTELNKLSAGYQDWATMSSDPDCFLGEVHIFGLNNIPFLYVHSSP